MNNDFDIDAISSLRESALFDILSASEFKSILAACEKRLESSFLARVLCDDMFVDNFFILFKKGNHIPAALEVSWAQRQFCKSVMYLLSYVDTCPMYLKSVYTEAKAPGDTDTCYLCKFADCSSRPITEAEYTLSADGTLTTLQFYDGQHIFTVYFEDPADSNACKVFNYAEWLEGYSGRTR